MTSGNSDIWYPDSVEWSQLDGWQLVTAPTNFSSLQCPSLVNFDVTPYPIILAPLQYLQGTHWNCIFKFCVFPVRPQIFPVPIYMICDYYIHKTNLADLSSFRKKWQFSRQLKNIFYLSNQGNYNLSKPNSCFWGKFPNSLCFPWQGIFLGNFPSFSCAVDTLLYFKLGSTFLGMVTTGLGSRFTFGTSFTWQYIRSKRNGINSS